MSEVINSCNDCRKNLGTEYHCAHCDDLKLFELYEMSKMSKLSLDSGKQSNSLEKNKEIQGCIQSFMHSIQCQEAECQVLNCQHMKMIIRHCTICKLKKIANKNCPICEELIKLIFCHAKYCQEKNCAVFQCQSINRKWEEQRLRKVEAEATSSSGTSTLDPPI